MSVSGLECPKCKYRWVPRVASPRFCPSCTKSLNEQATPLDWQDSAAKARERGRLFTQKRKLIQAATAALLYHRYGYSLRNLSTAMKWGHSKTELLVMRGTPLIFEEGHKLLNRTRTSKFKNLDKARQKFEGTELRLVDSDLEDILTDIRAEANQ